MSGLDPQEFDLTDLRRAWYPVQILMSSRPLSMMCSFVTTLVPCILRAHQRPAKCDHPCVEITLQGRAQEVTRAAIRALPPFCGLPKITDCTLSSTELQSGNAIGAFLQTPAPVLDKISGPMGARFFIQYWAGVWQPHRASAIPPSTRTG